MMKKLLMKWLEVPDVSEMVSRRDIKEAVEDAIYEAFQPIVIPGYMYSYFDRHEHKDIRGALDLRIKEAVSAHFDKETRKSVFEFVDTESFIDSIVARIKVKQL